MYFFYHIELLFEHSLVYFIIRCYVSTKKYIIWIKNANKGDFMPDNKNSIRISILEKSFNYMERFLPLSIGKDYDETFANFMGYINKEKTKTSSSIELEALDDAVNKVESLSYEEIVEIVEMIS